MSMKSLKARTVASTLLCLTQMATVQAQSMAQVTFAGVDVNLAVPRGYCAIDRQSDYGAPFYRQQENGNSGVNRVALLFADCKELGLAMKTPGLRLTRYGNFLFPLNNGREALMPPSFGRSEIVKVFESAELRGKDLTKGLSEQLNEKMAKAGENIRFTGPMTFGLIDRDGQAAYMGNAASIQSEGQTNRVYGVTAATMTRRVTVLLNLYGPPSQVNPFRDLLTQQKESVKALIVANE